MWGVDAGFVNIAGAVKGFQIGGVNLLEGESVSSGLQIGLVNYGGKLNGIQGGFSNSSAVNGMQLGLFNNGNYLAWRPIFSEDDANGFQLSIINVSRKMSGLQLGLLGNRAERLSGVQIGGGHRARDVISGIQVGMANRSDHVRGVQIGFLNMCEYLTGVQIGLANIVGSGRNALPFFPVINIG